MMRLADAQQLCGWWQAKLIITGRNDPLRWGTVEETGFGTLYMWTMGHTVPMMQCQFMKDLPKEEDQEVCVCGAKHGFPKDRLDHLMAIAASDRWEPVNPITLLDAMVRDPPP